MIDGVQIKDLTRHLDERGYVMEILRSDDPLFQRFGQVYVSACFPGMIKAWHAHERQTDCFCCLQGNVKIGLYDDRPDSPTNGQADAVVIGVLRPRIVMVPPGIWHGFMAVGDETAVVLNVPNEVYVHENPDELRRPCDDPQIPFNWKSEGW